ncbi:hypothetical protein ACFY19_17385 [Streptosporangium saharense]|uniref:hypothetical protein n=1 Tax=Streptosporangium saharense TaxID=1706840 RepID=UPI0036CB5373
MTCSTLPSRTAIAAETGRRAGCRDTTATAAATDSGGHPARSTPSQRTALSPAPDPCSASSRKLASSKAASRTPETSSTSAACRALEIVTPSGAVAAASSRARGE